jgi:O-antigen/teichoic acid export membrane protein
MTTTPIAVRLGLTISLPAGVQRLAGSLSVTFTGYCALLLGLFLITRVSASVFGAVGFGEYQVARRTLAVVALPLMCGLGVSLPRYIARDIDDKQEVVKWLFSGLVLAAMLIALFLGMGIWWSAKIGQLAFGNGGRHGLVLALLVAVVGMFCTTLLLSVMRGLSRFHSAAALQIVNGVLVPLTGVLLAAGHVGRALGITGGLWIAIACGVFARVCWKRMPLAPSALQMRSAIRALLVFGAPRVPADIGLFGLFALPAYAAVHRNDIVGAGFLSVGLSLIQAVAALFSATGFVLLPYWSRAAKSSESLIVARKRMVLLVIGSALVSTLGLVVLQLFLRPIAQLLLGPLADVGLQDLRYVAFGAVPYVIYLILRDYFDAISTFPMNTVALTVAIVVQAVLLGIHGINAAVATSGSFLVLGIMMIAMWIGSARWSQSGRAPLNNKTFTETAA